MANKNFFVIMSNMNEENKKNLIEKIKEKIKIKPEKITIEMRLIGWTGTILIITAYTLNSWGYLNSQGLIYPILNLIGAFFMGIRIWVARNWSNFFLEIFWAAVAIISIIKFFIS